MGLDQYLYEMQKGMTPQEVAWNTQEKAYWRKDYSIREFFFTYTKPVKDLENYYIVTRNSLKKILLVCLNISIDPDPENELTQELNMDKESAIYSVSQLLKLLQESDAETFLYVESY